jgi:hypothetical protein
VEYTVIVALGRLRQEGLLFEASLGYAANLREKDRETERQTELPNVVHCNHLILFSKELL